MCSQPSLARSPLQAGPRELVRRPRGRLGLYPPPTAICQASPVPLPSWRTLSPDALKGGFQNHLAPPSLFPESRGAGRARGLILLPTAPARARGKSLSGPGAGRAAARSRGGPAPPRGCGRGQPSGQRAPGRAPPPPPARPARGSPAHRPASPSPAAPPGPCPQRPRAAPQRTRWRSWSTTSTRSTSTRTPLRCASLRRRPAFPRRRPR